MIASELRGEAPAQSDGSGPRDQLTKIGPNNVPNIEFSDEALVTRSTLRLTAIFAGLYVRSLIGEATMGG